MRRNFFLVILSGILLALAFPKINWWPLAWFGLVPLLFALDSKSIKQSFGLAYLCGIIFFIGTVFWFIFVTKVGAVLLILYFSLYFGLFGLLYYFLQKFSSSQKLILIPTAWVVCEFLRSTLLTGFGWVCLGHSQYQQLPLIQIADLTGVYGVSFWIVMVNVLIKEIIDVGIVKRQRIDGKCIVLPMLIMMIVLIYGLVKMAQPHKTGSMKMAVVQANIDLPTHWNEAEWLPIIHKHLAMSDHASMDSPDLIIWPETSFPGFLWEDALFLTELKKFIKEKNIPVLFGSVIEKDKLYYNSVVFLGENSSAEDVYHKMHLVPYGEYIPYRKYLPFLSVVIPIDDFTPGKNHKIFELNGNKFAALICFEDTVAGLVRQFVKEGAGLLVNLSNDAWFHDTSEPWMHLQAAVFRSIENRRALVRASNVGISGFVDQTGRIETVAKNPDGDLTYVEAVASQGVFFNDKLTFYTRFGDVFSYICIGIMLLILARKRLKQA